MNEREALERRREALKALPAPSAPADGWTRLQRALRRERRSRWLGRASLMAAAAALAWIVLEPSVGVTTRRAPQNSNLAALMAGSKALEDELGSMPEPEVVNVEDADARAELEDEVAWVDACLHDLGSAAPEAERAALWKIRISLQKSLLKARRPDSALVSL